MYTHTRPSTGSSQLTMGLTTIAAADARMSQRISFDVPFAVIFLAALHGFSIFKIVAILYLNYSIAKKLPRQYIPAATWVFNVGILFTNELCRGYSYSSILACFLPGSLVSEKGEPATNMGHILDNYGGLIPRWEVLFNFTVLRLISFNLDYYWSVNSRSGSPIEVHISPLPLASKLMTSRRNNSIPPTSPSATASPSRQKQKTSASATTSHTLCTRPCTSQVQSSHSTITCLSCGTARIVSLRNARSSTLSVLLLFYFAWRS
jgi:hypothetical protein